MVQDTKEKVMPYGNRLMTRRKFMNWAKVYEEIIEEGIRVSGLSRDDFYFRIEPWDDMVIFVAEDKYDHDTSTYFISVIE